MIKYVNKNLMRSRKFGKIIGLIRKIFCFEEISFSQNCEDIIITHFTNQKIGIYVDVGAHNPIRFSNTLQLYYSGWHGINIDPLPGCMREFRKYRPNDINLNVGISSLEGKMNYYQFEEPAYNTLSIDRAKNIIKLHKSKMIKKDVIKVVSLKKVFDTYIKDKIIDVLNIDVETMEYDVLISNDWDKYRPKLIVMESIVSFNTDIYNLRKDRAINYLYNQGYKVIAKVGNAVFLK